MKRVRCTAATGLAMVLLASAGGATAGAATTGETAAPKSTVTAQTKTKRGDAIQCKIHTANPHYSHHAHGANRHRVNVVATVTCTKGVDQLSERVGLYKSGKIYKRSGVATVKGKKFVKQNASRRCVKNRNYAGYAKASVIFPAGYTPRTAKLSDKSPTVKIRACKKKK